MGPFHSSIRVRRVRRVRHVRCPLSVEHRICTGQEDLGIVPGKILSSLSILQRMQHIATPM